jgi:hypothetical protein
MVLVQTGHSRWSKSEIMDRQIHEIGGHSLTSDRFVEGYFQFIHARSRESRTFAQRFRFFRKEQP